MNPRRSASAQVSGVKKEQVELLKHVQSQEPANNRRLCKMVKRTLFSRSVFSLGRNLGLLIPVMAVLCSTTGLLIGTAPAYAAPQLTVIFNTLGGAQSATVLFRGQPLGNPPCVTQAPSRIIGDVSGGGGFSVNFYSTNTCSGPRTNFFRFHARQGSISVLVACLSDTNCICKGNGCS